MRRVAWRWYLAFSLGGMTAELLVPSETGKSLIFLTVATSAVIMTGSGFAGTCRATRFRGTHSPPVAFSSSSATSSFITTR